MIQKSTFVVAIAVSTLGIAGLTLGRTGGKTPGLADGQYLIQTTMADKESRHWDMNLGTEGVKHVRIDLSMSEVNVTAGKSSNFHADVTKEVEKPLDADERDWLEKNWIEARRVGDTIIFSEVSNQKPKLTGKKGHQIDLKVNIEMPKGLDADVALQAGELNLKGDYGVVKGQVSAGQLTTSDFRSDSIDFDVQAGEVDATLAKAPRRDSSISVGVGQIDLNLKDSASLDASVKLGNIEVGGESDDDQKGLGAHQEIKVGSGGTKVRLKVATGSISVSQGKTERRFEEKSGFDFSMSSNAELDDATRKEIEAEVNQAQREAQSAMADAQKEMERALSEHQFDIEKDQKFDQGTQREIEKAMREAQKAMEEARKEMNLHLDKDLSRQIQEATKDAMKTAKKAMELAQKEVQKALKKSLKERKDESI